MLLPLKEQIRELFTKLEQEKKEREDDEKEIIRNINDNIFDLNDKLNNQNKIIDDINKFLKTFQDTLKIQQKKDKYKFKNKIYYNIKFNNIIYKLIIILTNDIKIIIKIIKIKFFNLFLVNKSIKMKEGN